MIFSILFKKYEFAKEDLRSILLCGLLCGLLYGLLCGLLSGLLCGLLYGLLSGLLCGLLYGLLSGLLCGLLCGLLYGLLCGLLYGLLCGLSFGLLIILIHFSEALPYFTNFYPLVFLILGILLVAEIFFFLTPYEKVAKKKIFWYTTKKKFESVVESLLLFSGIAQLYLLCKSIEIHEYFPILKDWISGIGMGVGVLTIITLIVYLWIKVNSLRYQK